MAQLKQPEVLFKQQEIREPLAPENDCQLWLRNVTVYAPGNVYEFPGSEMADEEFQERNIEFSILFRYDIKSEKGGSRLIAIAYFANDSANYKIYQSEFLEDLYYLEKIPKVSENDADQDIPRQISFEPSVGVCRYAGNSDNENLLCAHNGCVINISLARD